MPRIPFPARVDYPLRRHPPESCKMSHPNDYDASHPDHHPETISRNARNGLILFGVYVVLYVGFMLLNTFAAERMQKPALFGVNLAIVYGVGLIVAALLLALVYMFLCRPRDTTP